MTDSKVLASVADIPRRWSVSTPDKPALIDPLRTVTYAELEARSTAIAGGVIEAGVRAGSNVGFVGKNSAAFFEVWFGANKAE